MFAFVSVGINYLKATLRSCFKLFNKLASIVKRLWTAKVQVGFAKHRQNLSNANKLFAISKTEKGTPELLYANNRPEIQSVVEIYDVPWT